MRISISRPASWAVFACTAVLCGCSATSPIWTDTKVEGPPLADGGKTTVMCKRIYPVVQLFPASGSGFGCYWAFSAGDRLFEYGKIYQLITDSLPLAKPLHPFMKAHYKEYHPKRFNPDYQRYTLHLATLVPIVIVGVPMVSGEWNGCAGSFDTGCFYVGSPETMQTYAHYGKPLPVREGSFVLIPESGEPPTSLQVDMERFNIEVGVSRVTLVQEGGFWRPHPHQPLRNE